MKKYLIMMLGLSGACKNSVTKDSFSNNQENETEVNAICTTDAPVGLEVEMCAPEFTLPDTEGEIVSLSSFRGKIALVDISAVW